jgi:hypothetical protein
MVVKIPKNLEMKSLLPAPRSHTSFSLAEHGPGATFHSLEVSQLAVGSNTVLRPPQEMECNNTSPKSIEDYMRKSAQFGYGRIGS